MAGALEGIRVVEFANYVSGPYAGMLLGDFGAEVIKVEAPDGGDPFRGWGRVEYSPTFGSVNRNKKSVVLDLKSAEGLAAARALTRTADVLIENFRTGTMERLGLGYEQLSRDNPRLVWCSITGFGPTGPYASRPGYDTVGQSVSGLLSLLTDLDRPRPMGISLSDHLAGITACNGILGALVARGRTGKGQRVETSLLEATVSFLGENAARYFENGKVPDRAARTHQAQVYAFVASDGKPFVIHLSTPAKFWKGLANVVGRPQWIDDARFATKEARSRHYDVLHGELAAIFKTDTRDNWLAKLQAADVPAASLNRLDEVFADPQVKHLGLRRDVPHKRVGSVGLIRNAVRMSVTPPEIHSASPELGEHTDEILAALKVGV
ncbi:MAG TPA: CaiB/BaiF CoA-transferase family protein [Xanthobacteraceae bacterium]|nr:CaiB/BaiF CoA-transferase family protein [Xanthobacteraceae bacterium]